MMSTTGRWLVTVLCTAAAAVGCTSLPGAARGTSDDAAAYAVYTSLLQLVPRPHYVATKTIAALTSCVRPSGPHAAQIQEALADQLSGGTPSQVLRDGFAPSAEVHLLSDAEVRTVSSYFGNEGDRPVGTPTAVTTFSAVGFSRDRTVAVVDMGHHCGRTCGIWASHVLLKVGEGWKDQPDQVACRMAA